MRYYVEGWTKPIDYQLKIGGLPFNATGMTVALELRDRNGAVVNETGSTTWLDATQSKVRYTPNAADLTNARSPMKVRFRVQSGADIEWFPQSSGGGGNSSEEWVIGLP